MAAKHSIVVLRCDECSPEVVDRFVSALFGKSHPPLRRTVSITHANPVAATRPNSDEVVHFGSRDSVPSGFKNIRRTTSVAVGMDSPKHYVNLESALEHVEHSPGELLIRDDYPLLEELDATMKLVWQRSMDDVPDLGAATTVIMLGDEPIANNNTTTGLSTWLNDCKAARSFIHVHAGSPSNVDDAALRALVQSSISGINMDVCATKVVSLCGLDDTNTVWLARAVFPDSVMTQCDARRVREQICLDQNGLQEIVDDWEMDDDVEISEIELLGREDGTDDGDEADENDTDGGDDEDDDQDDGDKRLGNSSICTGALYDLLRQIPDCSQFPKLFTPEMATRFAQHYDGDSRAPKSLQLLFDTLTAGKATFGIPDDDPGFDSELMAVLEKVVDTYPKAANIPLIGFDRRWLIKNVWSPSKQREVLVEMFGNVAAVGDTAATAAAAATTATVMAATTATTSDDDDSTRATKRGRVMAQICPEEIALQKIVDSWEMDADIEISEEELQRRKHECYDDEDDADDETKRLSNSSIHTHVLYDLLGRMPECSQFLKLFTLDMMTRCIEHYAYTYVDGDDVEAPKSLQLLFVTLTNCKTAFGIKVDFGIQEAGPSFYSELLDVLEKVVDMYPKAANAPLPGGGHKWLIKNVWNPSKQRKVLIEMFGNAAAADDTAATDNDGSNSAPKRSHVDG